MNCDFLSQQNSISLVAAVESNVASRVVSYSYPAPPSKYLIKLDTIRFDGRVFDLKDPLALTLYQEGGLWHCEWDHISSAGETPLDAGISFSEDFSVLWDEIAQCSDDTLTEEAQSLKHHLLSVVKSVSTR